ncbi:Hypothetical protein NTJ_14912 [Nesidiocoris tenuis]|uniref:Reverse transcriptase domain-containing protein n=2 Tax=Nesidiocoris tenuis TaxID=355587 RepID=A0ABN7BEG8_9HEMI|nr:Hypothetical protein NTJ_14912 [Nesidiocoris tenuis]
MNSSSRGIAIVTWNCRGLNNKYHELNLFLSQHQIDLVLLTETKMAPHLHFHMPGYKIYRADHPSESRQAGSAILVRNNIPHSQLLPIRQPDVQIALIQLNLGTTTYKIGSFYSQPESQQRLSSTAMQNVINEMGQRFLLGGDFNAKHPRWGSATTNPRGRSLHDVIYQRSLQVMSPVEPTHFPDNAAHSPDILDFFIGREIQHIVSPASVIHDLSSDHYPVSLSVDSSAPADRNMNHFDCIHWSTYTEILTNMTVLNVPLKTKMDIDKSVSKLNQLIISAATSASSSPTQMRPQLTPPHILQLLAIKRRARALWESTKYPPYKANFRSASKDLKKALTQMKADNDRQSLTRLDSKDGSLWRKSKSLLKNKDSIPPLKLDGRWYATNEEKSDLFSNLLEAQFSPNPSHSQEFDEHVAENLQEPLQLSIFNDFLTPAQVKNAIRRSGRKKAAGYDHITQPMLNHLPRKTLVLVTQIYNAILRTGYFPSKWKHACVIMIPKPQKNPRDPTSYRPISLLPLLAKIFEKLVIPKLFSFLAPSIPEFQFGFRPMHSCQQQIHRVVEEILDSYERKQVCQGVFLDTQKAFDKAWHMGILYKTKPLLPDSYYRLVQSYLAGRTFSVKIENALSTSRTIRSGVPQGSVWGPLLYLLYVSDVPTSPTTVSAMFADDEAILSRDRDGLVATTGLQKHLDEIALWSKKWRLVMNSSKSFNVIFTYRRNHVVSPLSLDGAIIPTMDAVRYLGITLDRRLTFRSHITDLVKRIRQRTRMLLPLLGRRSTLGMPMKRLLYLMLIRPIWQYGCSIWGASCTTQIRRIQAQQNRVLRLITDAPWFVRSSILHRDLDIQMVQEVIQSTSTRTHQTMTNHPNPVFVDYEDLLESSRGDRRLKKKRPVDLL